MAKKKSPSNALETQQTAELAWLANQWQEHPVIGLTPARLHQLLTDAEQGNLQAQADLFCDMEERDGHIFSEMDKRKKAINGLAWEVVPPKNASEQEVKIAAEVNEWIDDIEDLEMVLFDCMDAVGHGYSCQTIEWQRLGNVWLPARFEHIHPRHFLTPYDRPNELRLNDGTVEGAEFWDFGWLIHQHKAKSGYLSRHGLHRVLAWSFLFKNYGVRDVMEFLEIYGLPIRIGKYPSGATQEEKLTLARAVMAIGRSAGGIIPQGMAIDFESAANGDTDNHMALIKWCELTQSKVIVGGTLLSQADGKTSTNAQSRTHEVQFETLVKSDAKQLARSLNDGLIGYLMRLNYPQITADRYPKFKFDTSDIEDIQTFSEALPKLVNIGFKIPRAWAQEKLGIPQPTDDEDVLGTVSEQAQVQPQMPTQMQMASNSQAVASADSVAEVSVPGERTAIDAQLFLDEQMQARLSNPHLQNIADGLLPQILEKLQSTDDIDGALTLLAEAMPEHSLDQLQDDLSKLLFAADVLGRLSVAEGRKRG